MKDSKINKYDFLFLVLILCTAAGMWGGAFKPARVFSIAFFIPLLSSYKKVRVGFLKEVYLYLLFLSIWSFVSLLWSPNASLGIAEWGNMLLRILFLIELLVFGVLSKDIINTMINGWSIAFLITAIIAVWELNTGNHLAITNYVEGSEKMNLGGGNYIVRQYASATFYNYNGYVTYICYCLPFLFSLGNRWTKGIKQIIAVFPIVLVLYVFILNASRGGIIGFIIYFVVFSYYRLSKAKLSVKVTFMFLLIGVLFLFANFWDLMSVYLEHRLTSDGMSSSRFQIWSCCWQALKETAFIGCGIGGVISALTAQHAHIPLPHNFFIEVLLEFGIFIFIWLIVLIWKTIRLGRNCKDYNIRFVRLSSLLALPFITIIDSEYLQSMGIWAFLGSLLLINLTCRNVKPDK